MVDTSVINSSELKTSDKKKNKSVKTNFIWSVIGLSIIFAQL